MTQRLYTTRWEIERGPGLNTGGGPRPWYLTAHPTVAGSHRIGRYGTQREAIKEARKRAGPHDAIFLVKAIA